MSFHHFTYLLVIIISITCRTLSSIPIKAHHSDSFIENHEEFIPTNEWQMVKEGRHTGPLTFFLI